jgi:hypothetical protein
VGNELTDINFCEGTPNKNLNFSQGQSKKENHAFLPHNPVCKLFEITMNHIHGT